MNESSLGRFRSDLQWKMLKNGWRYHRRDCNDQIFKLGITLDYDVDCFANVDYETSCVSELGVWNVYANYSPDEDIEPPYDIERLEELIMAVECAENNLIAVGIPFIEDYDFHGDNKDEKSQRNMIIRTEWKLDELEKEEVEA